MPFLRVFVTPDRRSGLHIPGRKPLYPLGRLMDQRQQQGKIDPFPPAKFGCLGIQIIGEIVDEDGRQVQFQPGGIVRVLHLWGEGTGKGFDRRQVLRLIGVHQEGYLREWPDGGLQAL